MARKKKVEDTELQRDINDIYNLLDRIQHSIDILVKAAETIAKNTSDRTGFF